MVKKMLSAIPSGHDGDGYVTINGKACAAFKISSVSAEVPFSCSGRSFYIRGYNARCYCFGDGSCRNSYGS